MINSVELTRVAEEKDPDVIFLENFEFDKRLNLVVSEAFKILGFATRSSAKFKSDALFYTHKTLIRPILLWNT